MSKEIDDLKSDNEKKERLVSCLIAENDRLKNLVTEGKVIFSELDTFLGMKKAAESNFFLAKVSTMITKVQRNPNMFNNLIAYVDKINKIEV